MENFTIDMRNSRYNKYLLSDFCTYIIDDVKLWLNENTDSKFIDEQYLIFSNKNDYIKFKIMW